MAKSTVACERIVKEVPFVEAKTVSTLEITIMLRFKLFRSELTLFVIIMI